MSEYCCTDVFRLAPLWNISSLVQIKQCTLKLYAFHCFWWDTPKWRPRHAHAVTPKWKILLTFHVTDLKSVHTLDIKINSVGGVCLSVTHVQFCSFLVTGGGHCEYGWIWVCKWVQGRTLIIHAKVWCILDIAHQNYKYFVIYGETLKMAATPCPHHDSKKKMLINFHVTDLKSVHTLFRDIQIKFIGGVC